MADTGARCVPGGLSHGCQSPPPQFRAGLMGGDQNSRNVCSAYEALRAMGAGIHLTASRSTGQIDSAASESMAGAPCLPRFHVAAG